MSHAFFSIMWMADCVQKKANRCKLGKRGPCHLCGCYFAPLTQALLQTACTHGNSTGSFRGLCGLPPIKNNSWWFKEHDSESECWLGLQIPQILTEPSICGICWTNKCDTWRPGWQLKGPEASVCISWYLTPLLDVSGLFEQQKGNQHNIRQMVIKLTVIWVFVHAAWWKITSWFLTVLLETKIKKSNLGNLNYESSN